jgi:hypothetical protein
LTEFSNAQFGSEVVKQPHFSARHFSTNRFSTEKWAAEKFVLTGWSATPDASL